MPKGLNVRTETVSTPDGEFVLWFSEKGLAAIRFPGGAADTRVPAGAAEARPSRRWRATAHAAILDVLHGRQPRRMPPLDMGTGTAFQRAVWEVIHDIPFGQTLSYGDVARAIGKPGAVRAVG